MKANEANFLKFLQGSKQFIIPIYQRKYSWTISQCTQLWQDILRISSDDKTKAHFIGSVVYIEKGIYNVTAVPQLLVIDGQQRLTTLSLLLLAFSHVIQEQQEDVGVGVTSKKMRNYYLINNDEEGELHYRLILTKSDKESLIALIENRELDNYAINIQRNYAFFKNEIQRMNLSLDDLYNGLSKLIMVDIALDRENDNPQLIFESLNSTGLDLSQADLIRNYLLMGLEPKVQEELYESYWRPIELGFGNLTNSTVFDRFMRDYLTVKTEKIPNMQDIYKNFKAYIGKIANRDIEKLLKDMHQYAKYYTFLAFQQETDTQMKRLIKDISTLKVDVSYPLLLQVYKAYDEQLISEEDMMRVLRLVESYVFRRVICEIPTNSLNKTFLSIMKEVVPSNIVQGLETELTSKTGYRRYPNDAEFARELKRKDVYNFRNRTYLLRKLENFNRKEIVNLDEYTIEHIMPQNKNLSEAWQTELGDDWAYVHENYLHTLGNLTLTRYNSELSDRPFRYKMTVDGGFKDSPLRLNRSVTKHDVWNKESIECRAEELIEQAKKIWLYPTLVD